jgi:hypothetical protein
MVDGSSMANLAAYNLENGLLPRLSIYGRYGIYDRMGDGFVDPPNRKAWTFDQLYTDWNAHGFFANLRKKGYITVSYAGNAYIDFIPCAANRNRHQAIALACFLDSCYAATDLVIITAPHETGDGDFIATFETLANGGVKYTTQNGIGVFFKFDSSRPSQI